MAEKDGKHASLNPKDFHETPWAERSLDEILRLEAPVNDHDAHLNFRSPPDEWEQAASELSQAHLFFHAVKMESHCKVLSKYRRNRGRVKAMTEDRRLPRVVRKMLNTFMLNRPKFAITELTTRIGVRHYWNAWDNKTLKDHHSIAKESNIAATTLWLVYSSKAMATSSTAGANTDELQDKLVSPWYTWLKTENKEFEDLIDFMDVWYDKFERKS